MDPTVVDPRRPTTAAVVLNFRTPEATNAAVRSLRASSSPPAAVFVVDNASGDGSVARIRAADPRVDVLEAPANLGFAAGCNLGIRAALARGAARILLLNSDAGLRTDTLARLEAALDGDTRIGIAGPVVVAHHDAALVESAGIRYSPTTGRMRHDRSAPSSTGGATDVREVDGVSGSVMLVTREVLDAVGLFAEEYFYGFEDLELCVRARRQGFRCVVVARAIAAHAGAASMGATSPRRLYFAVRNHLLLASRVGPQHAPVRHLRAAHIVGLNLAHTMVRSRVRLVDGLAALGRGVRDHWNGRYGPDDSTNR